ncbi:MAG TPA: ZIP family metal transporter [Terracidiphilus sp.]|nr:ZIP family metal transporter [Terracidiphilus sp.]
MNGLSLVLGFFAALANVAGGLVLVRARGIEPYLGYFVSLGAAFLMSAALLEMMPESMRVFPRMGALLIMAGYCAMHLVEHTINTHFHYGEETHHGEFLNPQRSYSVLGGWCAHSFFDGVAIGAGFEVSGALGWLIFLAIVLHKAPAGFAMASVMVAGGHSRAAAFYSTVGLAASTVGGVLLIQLIPHWLPFGLPFSTGVALYVGASDLIPEVNREPGIKMALVFFLGVGAFLLLRMLLPAL